MMRNLAVVALLVSLLITACGGTEQADQTSVNNSRDSDKPVDISGTWETVYLKVTVNTVNNTDSGLIIEAHLPEFPAKLGIQRNIGTYNSDGTYQDNYILPTGDSATSSGNWYGQGDTLVVEQSEPEYRLHKFRCELKGDTGIFTGPVDFDSDGQKDDDFYGISVLR